MTMPGFTADASLGTASRTYWRGTGGSLPQGDEAIAPQARFGSDPDIGAYLRCRANGGSELVCRFFGGLPPFTIGRVFF